MKGIAKRMSLARVHAGPYKPCPGLHACSSCNAFACPDRLAWDAAPSVLIERVSNPSYMGSSHIPVGKAA